MDVRRFALILGIIFTVVGIAGFIPALLQAPGPDAPGLTVDAFHGRLLGLFPVNLVHNLVHLGIGIWGLAVAKSTRGAVNFSRSLAIIYGLLAIMGFIPGLQTMFGLAPLHGHDIWLHAGTALLAAYYGFARKYDMATSRM